MKILSFLKKYLNKHKSKTIWFIFLGLVLWVASILTPFIVGDYIDTLTGSDNTGIIWRVVATLAVIWTLQIILAYVKNMISARINTLISFDVNFDIIEHLKQLPMKYFTSKDPAYINQRVSSDSSNVTGFVLGSVLGLITTALTFILALAIMFFINVEMTMMICLIFPVYILIYIKFRQPLYDMGYKLAEESNAFFSHKNKQLSNVKLIKQNAWNERMGDELQIEFGSLFKTTMQNAKLGYIFNNADTIVRYMANMIIFIYSGYQIMYGDMTIGQFTMINSYSLMVISSLSVFLGFGRSYRNSLVAYDRIQEIYAEEQEQNGTIQLEEIKNIDIRNLNFNYGEKSIIQNLNTEFNKGNIYAIIGENGSGKSTLLDIITGLQQDYTGDILYNGTSLKDLDAYHLRNHHIAVVEQEPNLYFDTIEENTTKIQSHQQTHNHLNYWLKRLSISELISLDNPSGGEKQRIATAIALTKNANVLIMDEPNSALDKASLQVLCDILYEIRDGKIIILVTHSQQLISICDFSIVL